jgi:flagella basal body P-ring formation protein FlgA
LEAAGFSYTITPNTTGVDSTPEYVTVDLKYKVRSNKKDPQTGQINSSVEEKSYLHKINLVGTDAKSPDEIVGKLQTLYYENMLQNRSIQLEYDKVKATNGGTVWDPKAALKSAGLSHLIK